MVAAAGRTLAAGGTVTVGQAVAVSAAALPGVAYTAGTDAGTHRLSVRAFNGVLWSDWIPWTMTTAAGPVPTPVPTLSPTPNPTPAPTPTPTPAPDPLAGFDGLIYLASNADLAAAFGADRAAGLTHYLAYGRAEGRSTTAFDAMAYLAGNTDVAAALGPNRERAAEHYLAFGRREGCAVRFDAAYLAANRNVAAVFGTDLGGATEHYVRAEGPPGPGRHTLGEAAPPAVRPAGHGRIAGRTAAARGCRWGGRRSLWLRISARCWI